MKEPEQRRTTAGSQEREQLAGRGQEHEQVAWESDGDGKRRCGEGEDKVGRGTRVEWRRRRNGELIPRGFGSVFLFFYKR
jgi:hypothetical protein